MSKILSMLQTTSSFLPKLVIPVLTSVILYIPASIIYNLYFHPLRAFPGPKLNAASQWPYWIAHFRFRGHLHSQNLHEHYGPVVRIAPDRLEFEGAQAWRDMHSYAAMGGIDPKVEKDYEFYNFIKPPVPTIITADDATHTRYRRTMNHAFSTAAIKGQEPIMQKHVEEYLSSLSAASGLSGQDDTRTPDKVDIDKWTLAVLSDAIGDLALGQDLKTMVRLKKELRLGGDSKSDPNKKTENEDDGPLDAPKLLRDFRNGSALFAILGYRPFQIFLRMIIRLYTIFSGLAKLEQEATKAVSAGLKLRLKAIKASIEVDADKKDIAWYMISKSAHEKGPSMTEEEMEINLLLLIFAGIETTSILVSVTIWLILIHPVHHNKLTNLLRTTFPPSSTTPNPITLTALTDSSTPLSLYLDAILSESLRLFPAQPMTLPRQTTRPCTIAGLPIPRNTLVGISPYTSGRSPSSFARPDEFCPERWMSSSSDEFKNDDKSASQPFSVGPRDCIGRRLALFEAKLVIARLFWRFGVDLCEESRDWITGKQGGGDGAGGLVTGDVADGGEMAKLILQDSSWARPPLFVLLRDATGVL